MKFEHHLLITTKPHLPKLISDVLLDTVHPNTIGQPVETMNCAKNNARQGSAGVSAQYSAL